MKKCRKGLHDMTPENSMKQLFGRRCRACFNHYYKEYLREYRKDKLIKQIRELQP
jgi:hypothetical protein